MKITKEQKQRILELDPNFFNEKLEVGRWYKSTKSEALAFIKEVFRKDFKAFGFDLEGNWCDLDDEWTIDLSLWNPTTEQEVLKALTKEAVKRGFEEGRKFTSCVSKFIDICNGYFSYNEELNELYSNGTCVFSNGKWATIIQPKQMTIQEIEKELGYNIEIV